MASLEDTIRSAVPNGSIRIVKDAQPNSAQDFEFDVAGLRASANRSGSSGWSGVPSVGGPGPGQ